MSTATSTTDTTVVDTTTDSKITKEEYDILRGLKVDGKTLVEVAKDLGMSYDSARRKMRKMRDRGFVSTEGVRKGTRPTVTVDLRKVRPRS